MGSKCLSWYEMSRQLRSGHVLFSNPSSFSVSKMISNLKKHQKWTTSNLLMSSTVHVYTQAFSFRLICIHTPSDFTTRCSRKKIHFSSSLGSQTHRTSDFLRSAKAEVIQSDELQLRLQHYNLKKHVPLFPHISVPSCATSSVPAAVLPCLSESF